MEDRLKYRIKQFKDAVMNFKESLSINFDGFSEKIIDSLKSGRVQKYEFCVELLWKTLKVYLWEVNGIDSKSPKLIVKDFFNLGYLTTEEYEKIIEIIDDRNSLSNIYNKDQFEAIYNRVVFSLPLFNKVIEYIA